MNVSFSIVLVGVALLSAALTRASRDVAVRRRLLDPLTPRSSHVRPIPRLGGIAIVAATMAGWTAWQFMADVPDVRLWMAFVAGALIAAVTGLIDDLVGLRPLAKLAGQIAAVLPVLLILPLDSATLDLPGLVAVMMWAALLIGYINYVNFFDGSDGLAAGVTLINAVGLAALVSPGVWPSAVLSAGAAAAGFLWFNRPPASVFMGDAGSLFLGYVFALAGVILVASGISAVAVALVLTPIGFDCTYTLLRRLAAGERVWEAHRAHLYQRLLIAGWPHSRVAVLFWSWAGVAAGTALAYARFNGVGRGVMLVIAAAAAAIVVRIVHRAEHSARPIVVA